MKLNTINEDGRVEEKSAAEILGSATDLLIEIFQRLPLAPRFRFKAVSKHWLSLISDPKLCILRNPNPNPAVGIIFRLSPCMSDKHDAHVFPFDKLPTSPPFRELSFFPDDPWRRTKNANILNSCNGLLICGSGTVHSSWDYRVHNPITNYCSTIQEIEKEGWLWSSLLCAMILAYDPSKSHHYKVVCVLQATDDIRGSPFYFTVYSSEAGSWRDFFDKPFRAHVNFEDGVYWNGAIHWISTPGEKKYKKQDGADNDYEQSFKTGESIYFKLDDDDGDDDEQSLFPCEVMPTPPMIDEPSYMHVRYFGESGDHLHYFDVKRWVWYYREYEFNVYEMRRDYSEWFVKYKVDIWSAVNQSNLSFKISPYTVVRGKKDEDSFLVLAVEKKIVRYNLVFKTFETLYEFDGVGDCPIGPNDNKELPLQYIESIYDPPITTKEISEI